MEDSQKIGHITQEEARQIEASQVAYYTLNK